LGGSSLLFIVVLPDLNLSKPKPVALRRPVSMASMKW